MASIILLAVIGTVPCASAEHDPQGPGLRGCAFPGLPSAPVASPRTPLGSAPSSEPYAEEALELLPETYHSWQSDDYAMFAFEGRYVRVLVQTTDFPLLGKARMHELVDRCDRLYSTMRDLLSWEPGGDGRLSIALAVDTCGSGCGFVGWKGIEVEVDFHAYGAERIDGAYEAVWSILIHEMAHNFDPVSGPIFYTSDTAHAWTSFLNFYVMVADGNGTREHGPSFQRPRDVLDSMVGHFFDPYVRDAASTWSGCISGGDCTFPSPENNAPAKQRGAQGALLLKFAQFAGDDATHRMLRYLVNRVLADPGAWVNRPPQDKADLVVEAMSVAAGGSLAPVMDGWKWEVSPATRAALSAAFSGPPTPAIDQDGDGVSPAEGDCDDRDPTRFPRPGAGLLDLLSPCPAPAPDLPEIVEEGDYPGFREPAAPITFPVAISGAVQFEGDIDRFTFHLEQRKRLRFTLTSPDFWDGWCFFDHTRVYAVRASAGQTGILTVNLGPGQVGIRMESVDGQSTGGFRLGIEDVSQGGSPRWMQPVGDCTPDSQFPTLVEASDVSDDISPELGESPVPVLLPSQIVGQICPGDMADWYSLRLEEPTFVRINLFSLENFAGWVFLPSGDLVYCLKGGSGGGIFLLPAGTHAFRVVAQNHEPGSYRALLQREEPAFLQTAPQPTAAADGSWVFRTGPLPALPAAAAPVARFWVSGLGWIGSAPVRDGEAVAALFLPVDADPTFLNYRFQLFGEGTPVSPVTPSRGLVPSIRELPVGLRGGGLAPSAVAGTYDATFLTTRRGDLEHPGRVQVVLDGHAILSLESMPALFTLRGLTPGVHAVRLASSEGSPASAVSRSYPFAIFHAAELNAQALIPGAENPADLRSIRRVQSLTVGAVPPSADLRLFEALQHITVRGSVGDDAQRLLATGNLRRILAPASGPVLALTSRPGPRMRVRGFAFGRSAVLLQSGDLRTWSEVPYSGNAGPDEVIDVDLPAGPGPVFYRLVTR